MRANTGTDATAAVPEASGPRPRRYGVPSPDLLARADRGFALFLERTQHQDDGADGEQ
ncbi:hypothetical protein ACFO3J_25225 [Streptomyces polygonati]|uniref:DUF397 domain-containing protein n=1 Tax=Streptomyces polygonati TaxID=1617087 RepID=A0ABV8HUR9_9ACTN